MEHDGLRVAASVGDVADLLPTKRVGHDVGNVAVDWDSICRSPAAGVAISSGIRDDADHQTPQLRPAVPDAAGNQTATQPGTPSADPGTRVGVLQRPGDRAGLPILVPFLDDCVQFVLFDHCRAVESVRCEWGHACSIGCPEELVGALLGPRGSRAVVRPGEIGGDAQWGGVCHQGRTGRGAADHVA